MVKTMLRAELEHRINVLFHSNKIEQFELKINWQVFIKVNLFQFFKTTLFRK